MSQEQEEEALQCILNELRGINARLDKVDQDISNLSIVVVEHVQEGRARDERFDATLSQHASRIGTLERKSRSPNGG